MKDHFLLETIWILCSYGAGYSLGSLLIALLLVAWGSGRKRVGVRMALLGTAVLILWIGLILVAKQARVLWQGIPEPPQEAFSDTGEPFVVLFMGWFPALVLLGGVHFLLCRCRLKLGPSAAGHPSGTPPGEGVSRREETRACPFPATFRLVRSFSRREKSL